MKNSARIYLAAFLIFAAGLGWLFYTATSESSIYFLNVSEARKMPPDKLKQARLFGLVANGSISRNMTNLMFKLEDKDNANVIIPVSFSGTVPDTFKHGSEVIVEGIMKEDGSFMAKTLMTKCPSKYQKENRQI